MDLGGNNYQLVKIIDQPMSTQQQQANAPAHKETKSSNKRTKQTIASLTKQENLLHQQQLQNQPPLHQQQHIQLHHHQQHHQFNSNTQPLNVTTNTNSNNIANAAVATQAVSLMPSMTTLTLTNATQTNFVEPKKEPKVSPNTQLQNKRNSKFTVLFFKHKASPFFYPKFLNSEILSMNG
jgi:hypothetical protein